MMIDNIKTTKLLFKWMQKNLNQQSDFTEKDLKTFFAAKFTINTNGKIVHATPMAYLNYLYTFKKNVEKVQYKLQKFIESERYVVVPFNIFIKSSSEMLSQHLRVISIFKFNAKGKIVLWQELFTKI